MDSLIPIDTVELNSYDQILKFLSEIAEVFLLEEEYYDLNTQEFISKDLVWIFKIECLNIFNSDLNDTIIVLYDTRTNQVYAKRNKLSLLDFIHIYKQSKIYGTEKFINEFHEIAVKIANKVLTHNKFFLQTIQREVFPNFRRYLYFSNRKYSKVYKNLIKEKDKKSYFIKAKIHSQISDILKTKSLHYGSNKRFKYIRFTHVYYNSELESKIYIFVDVIQLYEQYFLAGFRVSPNKVPNQFFNCNDVRFISNEKQILYALYYYHSKPNKCKQILKQNSYPDLDDWFNGLAQYIYETKLKIEYYGHNEFSVDPENKLELPEHYLFTSKLDEFSPHQLGFYLSSSYLSPYGRESILYQAKITGTYQKSINVIRDINDILKIIKDE